MHSHRPQTFAVNCASKRWAPNKPFKLMARSCKYQVVISQLTLTCLLAAGTVWLSQDGNLLSHQKQFIWWWKKTILFCRIQVHGISFAWSLMRGTAYWALTDFLIWWIHLLKWVPKKGSLNLRHRDQAQSLTSKWGHLLVLFHVGEHFTWID